MIQFLLDTHVWLWLQATPQRVSEDIREALSDEENEILLSAASSWEISIKHELVSCHSPSHHGCMCLTACDDPVRSVSPSSTATR